MGFWVGFTRQFNEMQDRRQRRELLMQELGAKRQEKLHTLVKGKTARTKAKAKEQASMKALKARVGNAEGGEEWLASIAQSRLATETLNMVEAAEADARKGGGSLNLKGSALVGNVTPYAGEDGVELRPSLNLQRMLSNPTALADNNNYSAALQEAAALGAPRQEGRVVINPEALNTNNARDRTEASDMFFTRLGEDLAKRGDPALTVDINQMFNDENPTARSQARNKWVNSPEGFQIYQDMVTNQDVPGYSSLTDMGGTFAPLADAYQVHQGWDDLEEDAQNEALQRFEFLTPFVGD